MTRAALLGSTAMFGAGILANAAMAADGIKLGVGGFFNTAYMVAMDDDSEGELGNERNTDGIFNDAEIHFSGSDGAGQRPRRSAPMSSWRAKTEDDQIDEAWIYLLGRLRRAADRLDRRCARPAPASCRRAERRTSPPSRRTSGAPTTT